MILNDSEVRDIASAALDMVGGCTNSQLRLRAITGEPRRHDLYCGDSIDAPKTN